MLTRFTILATAAFLSTILVTQIHCFAPSFQIPLTSKGKTLAAIFHHPEDDAGSCDHSLSRKSLLEKTAASVSGASLAFLFEQSLFFAPLPAEAKCTDIESCREEGERKVEEDLKRNPIVKLSDGVRYRVLQAPPMASSSEKVREGSSIDLAYSISTASGQYMYSKGFGFEKVEFGGRQESDLGLDSLRVVLGKHNVPVGIEYALLGMVRGEKRRVELPPVVGFETSDWMPEPTTRRGKTQIEQYKRKLAGFGSQPPFPAETVWDIEVLGVRN
mmetsp:Transcript_45096/g.94564  ORF Transcript_45096/g.94564 Transcript_45096/m.94564 type:complete len:273 (-) Transcript_45096:2896-3714(-)